MFASIETVREFTVPYMVNECLKEKERSGYVIINCDEKMSNHIKNTDGYDSCEDFCSNQFSDYRSVVYDNSKKRLLSIGPTQSIDFYNFKEKYESLTTNLIHISEIIEGTMINMFYDADRCEWELATKGSVGANYWFYRTQYEADINGGKNVKQPTFREMFFQALQVQNMDALVFTIFPKDCCYTFVLQHPSNHIVLNIERPQVYLVAVHRLEPTEFKASVISPWSYQCWSCFADGIIQFPKEYKSTKDEELNYDILREKYCTLHNGNPNMVGLMFLNLETGERAHLENQAYSELRELRGNHPNLQYQYLCLMRIKRVQEFVKHFPQYSAIFWRFYSQWKDFVTATHQSYVSYYVKKSSDRISKRFFPLIYKLHHEVYLPSIANGSQCRLIMKRPVIQKWLETLEPAELIFYLNYPKTNPEPVA